MDDILKDCVSFVRNAVKRGLLTGDLFRTRTERGGQTHLGSADDANSELAVSLFGGVGSSLIIEEKKPRQKDWLVGDGAVFVDPIDGSAELGSGGLQFSAAVSFYDRDGLPLCGAAASPGLRPVFREDLTGREEGFTYRGFPGEMGAIVFGGPSGLRLLPLRKSKLDAAIPVPRFNPRDPDENGYTSIALDPNRGSLCGLKKGLQEVSVGLTRMPFSNIFAQMQVILGQADAATLGPTPARLVNGRLRGPKAWDMIMPLIAGAGLNYFTADGSRINSLKRELFDDEFLLKGLLFICHQTTNMPYIREIQSRFFPAYDVDS